MANKRRRWWMHGVGMVLAGWTASGSAAEPSRTDKAVRPPLVVVHALGPVPKRSLEHACHVLLEQYPVRCEIRPSAAVFEAIDAWDEHREQLDAARALQALAPLRSEGAGAELVLTSVDMFELDKPYVFGLASLLDRVAIISLARLGDVESAWDDRLQTLVLHEVGHTLGLLHHDTESCVMRQDGTLSSLDTAPDGPCSQCRARLHETAASLARPGGLALDRTRTHLARGDAGRAREELVAVLWDGASGDSDLLNAFALTFLEARRYNESISVLRYVVGQQPAFAEAHVNLAVAYETRGHEGDIERAVEHLEHALRLRPEWDLLRAHVLALRGAAAAAAQGPS